MSESDREKTPLAKASPTFALLNLPVELVEKIICTLCTHCQPQKQFITWRSDLVRLCLVSRLVRAIAQPILFHHYTLGWASNGATLLLFLRTLVQRPDLSQAVRTVHLTPPGYRGPDSVYYSIIADAARTCLEAEYMDQLFLWPTNPTDGIERVQPNWEQWSELGLDIGEFCEELLLYHTPQLENLAMLRARKPGSTRHHSSTREVSYENQLVKLNATLNLPFLRRLTLNRKLQAGYVAPLYISRFARLLATIKSLHTLETDAVGFMDPETSSQRIKAALTEAECANCLGNLKVLSFTKLLRMPHDELQHMVQMCTSLEVIQFSTAFKNTSPAGFVRAIEAAAPTLKRVKLDLVRLHSRNGPMLDMYTNNEPLPFSEQGSVDGIPYPSYEPVGSSAFQNFTALEVLWIDQAAYRPLRILPVRLSALSEKERSNVPPSMQNPGVDSDDDGEKLAKLLPPLIRVLVITNVYQPNIFDDLINLALMAASGHFSRLRKVVVGAEDYPNQINQWAIKSEFMKAGIVVEFGTVNEGAYDITDERCFLTA